MGISAHTDFEAFTLMHQDAPGLQFMSPHSTEWLDAPVRPGEFVVIVGDVLERFTNGTLKATPHRVINTAHERHSIIRFSAVHPDTLIEPLNAFVSEARPPLYTPVTMARHLETTIANLKEGKGAWDAEKGVSKTATYVYD
jgi:isopenicillin N synthase-like dioxygenase